jgi:hypothetical protein
MMGLYKPTEKENRLQKQMLAHLSQVSQAKRQDFEPFVQFRIEQDKLGYALRLTVVYTRCQA